MPGNEKGYARAILADAAERGARYLDGLTDRPVAPSAEMLAGLGALGGPLPDGPSDPLDVLRLLDEHGSPATVASAGPRYFGFVTGGTLPAALGAATLAAAWDQNACLEVMSPVAAALETAAAAWLIELFGLPKECAVGFTTGATMANLTGLAAARHAVLARLGWDVEERGLFGAPPIEVVVGEEVHVSLLKALSLLGLGRARVKRVPVDRQGRMRAEAFPAISATGHRLPASGQREYRRLRPARYSLPGRQGERRLGACRRRLRPVGARLARTTRVLQKAPRSPIRGRRTRTNG